jgi:hypothetical protein
MLVHRPGGTEPDTVLHVGSYISTVQHMKSGNGGSGANWVGTHRIGVTECAALQDFAFNVKILKDCKI